MTTLYINEEHCTSLVQLRSYFKDSLSYDSPIFYDLLDYARSGDLSKWLREIKEEKLANQLETINSDLGDADYFAEVCYIILGQKTQTPSKPNFSQYFTIENVSYEVTDANFEVSVSLKVLRNVNENYELKVKTEWGIHAENINIFKSTIDEVLTRVVRFRKRSNCELHAFTVYVDDKECLTQNINLPLTLKMENTISEGKTFKEILESSDSAELIRFLENNETPRWIISLIEHCIDSEEKHTATFDNTDNSIKSSERITKEEVEVKRQLEEMIVMEEEEKDKNEEGKNMIENLDVSMG